MWLNGMKARHKKRGKIVQCSEITLWDAIQYIDKFCPVKIIFNNIVLYNDYDSDVEISDGIYGEVAPPLTVIPDRIQKFDKSVVTSIKIDIVHFHHSIITMYGEYKENK